MKITLTKKLNSRGIVPICCALAIPLILMVMLMLGSLGNKGGDGKKTDLCTTAEYPNITDEAGYASAINQFIKDHGGSSSPMSGLGADYVAGAKKAGVSPAYIVTISLKESSFGTAGIALNGSHNAFGRKASSSQPDVDGWFKWSSWKASLNSTEDTEADYIKRKYIDEGKKTIDDIVPTYCPKEDNCDTDGYIEEIKGWITEINELAGEAVDCSNDLGLTNLSNVAGGGGGGAGTMSKVPLYKQWDSRWGSKSFGCGGTTMASSSCNVTSLAMVISYWTNSSVLPPETAKIAMDKGWRGGSNCNGIDWAAYTEMPKLYGLKAKSISWSSAKQYLKKGWPIIQNHSRGYFTNNGHYIVIVGINSDGTYKINDPDGKHRTKATEAQIVASKRMNYVIWK